MLGTIVNVIAIAIGSLLGARIGGLMPEKIKQIIMHALGLSTLLLGIHMGIQSNNLLIVMGSLLVGGILGELIGLDDMLNNIGKRLEERFSSPEDAADGRSISKAFVTSTLVFCIGPLAIIGAILDGLTGNSMPLFIKSILDGFASLAFSASLGIGVIFSAVPVFLYQGSIAFSAILLKENMITVSEQTPAIVELTATGGMLIVGIGLLLLDIKRIKLANFLPAIALAPLLVVISDYLK